MAPTVVEFLKLPMNKIIEKLDFKNVLTFRHVCKDLQNFIDDDSNSSILPEAHLSTIIIVVDTGITISYFWSTHHTTLHYELQENCNCLKTLNGKKKILVENVDFLDVAMRDLELILKFQKSEIETFTRMRFDPNNSRIVRSFDKLSEKLNAALKQRETFLKVKILELSVFKQSEVMAILPNVDPEILKTISIDSVCWGYPEILRVDGILKTEQWRKAEEFNFHIHNFSEKLEVFIIFNKVIVRVQSVSASELDILKKAFLVSENFVCFKANYSEFEDKEMLIAFWGPPVNESHTQSDFWHFRTSKSGIILEIQSCARFHYVKFSRKSENKIFSGAVVQD